jgi:hypothetical protein
LEADTEPAVDPEVQANLDFLNALKDALTNN